MKNDQVDSIYNAIGKFKKNSINGVKLFNEFENYMGKK